MGSTIKEKNLLQANSSLLRLEKEGENMEALVPWKSDHLPLRSLTHAKYNFFQDIFFIIICAEAWFIAKLFVFHKHIIEWSTIFYADS